jgi:hypothetical protein
MKDCALVSIFPHEAVGGCTPNPRKDTYASFRIAPAKPSVYVENEPLGVDERIKKTRPIK